MKKKNPKSDKNYILIFLHRFQPPEEPRDGSGLDRDALIANFAQVDCDCYVVR